MKTIIIDGKEIKTNIGRDSFSRVPDSVNASKVPFGMTNEMYLNEMVKKGYTKIMFYEETTAVRGYHHIYASCKF